MDITRIIEVVPDSVKGDIIDFTDGRMKDGKLATRVLIDRLLSNEEKAIMRTNKKITGVDYIATYRYAPEIKKSYFYILH